MASILDERHVVGITGRHVAIFLRNLEKRCAAAPSEGPSASTPSWDAGKELQDGAPNAWVPSLGTSQWLYEGGRYDVTFVEEGAPVGCHVGPEYFRRLTVSGHGRVAVQAFAAAMLKHEADIDPLQLGRVRTWASSACGEWQDRGFTPAQSLEDLFLPPASVQELTARLTAFAEAEARYAASGKMHKLSLLLMGVPGSGKSSLARAVARAHGHELYVLTLNRRMDDGICEELVETMAPKNLLLIEDFDSLGFSMSSKKKASKDEDTHGVTRSFFLNVLDGVLRPPAGTIICLTSNSCTGLDRALVRPGRVDVILRFVDPKEPEILAALNRLTQLRTGEDRSARFSAFLARLRKLKRGSLCMSGLVDHLFRYPSEYLERVAELESRCTSGDELTEDGPTTLYM